ncbi:MAG: thioredoxin family protein, partial [Pseudomonadota bacterium]
LAIEAPWPLSVRYDAKAIALNVDAKGLRRQRIKKVEFFVGEWGVIEVAAPQATHWQPGKLIHALKRSTETSDLPAELEGLLVITETLDEGDVRQGFKVRLPLDDKAKAGADGDAPSTLLAAVGVPPGTPGAPNAGPGMPNAGLGASGPAGGGIGFLAAIAFAFLGGMILNLMPCVLPILSLKILSLAGAREAAAGQDDGTAAVGSAARAVAADQRHHGYAYGAGALVSFAALAVLLIALREAGVALGWGFQFQSPAFVLLMIALFFALGLSLSGVFSIGGSLIGTGGSLAARPGHAGSFFTGMLASIAATPCTAPFMGVAVGYALTRPAYEVFAVLMALGIGFALPVVALSVSGLAARFIPRPGAWMETFKQVLAFPLYATVAWLVWVLSQQAGSDGVLAAGLVLVAVGFGAWLFGADGSSSNGDGAASWWRPVAAAGFVIVAFAAAWPFAQTRDSRALALDGPSGTPAQRASAQQVPADAVAFSRARIEALRREGRPVFVNLTAAWCISCKVNERLVLKSAAFKRGLDARNIAYVVGDWTNQDPEISKLLKAHARAGVPLYLLYPADPSKPAMVLPQLLTTGLVQSYLDKLPAGSRA